MAYFSSLKGELAVLCWRSVCTRQTCPSPIMPQSRCAPVLLCPNPIVPQSRYAPVLLCPSPSTPQSVVSNLFMPQSHCAPIPSCPSPVVPKSHCAPVRLCPSSIMPQSHSVPQPLKYQSFCAPDTGLWLAYGFTWSCYTLGLVGNHTTGAPWHLYARRWRSGLCPSARLVQIPLCPTPLRCTIPGGGLGQRYVC